MIVIILQAYHYFSNLTQIMRTGLKPRLKQKIKENLHIQRQASGQAD